MGILEFKLVIWIMKFLVWDEITNLKCTPNSFARPSRVHSHTDLCKGLLKSQIYVYICGINELREQLGLVIFSENPGCFNILGGWGERERESKCIAKYVTNECLATRHGVQWKEITLTLPHLNWQGSNLHVYSCCSDGQTCHAFCPCQLW